MLKNTLDKTMEKSMKLENKTIVSRFSNLRNINEEKSPEKELLMLQKISKYSNTNENKIAEIPKIDNIKNRPFFRSIQYKLSEQFCA